MFSFLKHNSNYQPAVGVSVAEYLMLPVDEYSVAIDREEWPLFLADIREVQSTDLVIETGDGKLLHPDVRQLVTTLLSSNVRKVVVVGEHAPLIRASMNLELALRQVRAEPGRPKLRRFGLAR